MKRCPACQSRAYYADETCRHCGAAIVPPPPRWLVVTKNAVLVACVPLFLFDGWQWLAHDPQGRSVVAFAQRAGRYLYANGGDIAGIVLAFVVAPLVALYFALRAMVDLGDWLDLKVQQWRAERFRKYGW